MDLCDAVECALVVAEQSDEDLHTDHRILHFETLYIAHYTFIEW